MPATKSLPIRDGYSASGNAHQACTDPTIRSLLERYLNQEGYLHAGLLDGYIHWRQNLSDALHRGAAAASIVCSRQGVQPPTAAEVDQMLNATTTAAPTC